MKSAARHWTLACFCGLAIAGWSPLASVVRADEDGQPAAVPAIAPEEAVRAAIEQYVVAYNQHDPKALAEKWVDQGVYVDSSTGERVVGREPLQREFEALFNADGTLSLAARVDAVRFIRPDVVEATGQAVSVGQDAEPRDSKFTALLIRDGEQWLIDSINETSLPTAAKPYDRLQALEFLVGRWVDDTTDARVDCTVRWGANRSFLVRSFTLERENGTTHQGTQVIGWDPRQERIRCWMFDSDGSFGEGTWSQSDDGWVVKISQTLADGRPAGGTQIITRIDDNTLNVQSVGQEIDGESVPASDPVRVVRVDSQVDR